MALNITTKSLSSDTIRKSVSSKKNKRSIRGKTVSAADSTRLIIANDAFKSLKSKGLVKDQNVNVSDNDLALDVLSSIGCSVSVEPIDMSLLSSQTDTETIDNENIFDEIAMSKITNDNIEAFDKFPNTDSDPFYTLDDAPPKTTTSKIRTTSDLQSIVDVQQITTDVVTLNFASKGTTLKQFK